MFLVEVDKVKLYIRKVEKVTSGSSKVFSVKFKFSEDWNGFDKVAVFNNGSVTSTIDLDDTEECEIPDAVLKYTGDIEIGIFGTNSEGAILPTLWGNLTNVYQGTTLGSSPNPPQPVEPSQPGAPGKDGEDGATFYPSVSEAGIISWTNDKGLSNPQPVNIKGPQGETGYDGVAGIDGKNGVTFTPDVSATGVISWTNDGGLENPEPVSIKGPPGDAAQGGGVPSGCILLWSGTTNNIPNGWALCDGQNGTPDLRDKFVLGAGTTYAAGTTGGSETVTLTIAQIPSHSHNLRGYSGINNQSSAYGLMPGSNGSVTKETNAIGNTNPHNNMPPYYTLAYIMKL